MPGLWPVNAHDAPAAAQTGWLPDLACFPQSAADLRAMAAQPVAFQFHYDPGIAEPFRTGFAATQGDVPDMDLWPLYDVVACPTLVLRGVQSDLLSPETAREMQTRGPKAALIEVPETGHAPSLLPDAQIDWIARFIAAAE